MSTRYDKVIKFEGKYLKVNALAPIILAKQLKKVPVQLGTLNNF